MARRLTALLVVIAGLAGLLGLTPVTSAAAATGDSCRTLALADLAFGDPLPTAPSGATSACYALPSDAAGLRIATSAMTSQAAVDVALVDSAGGILCEPTGVTSCEVPTDRPSFLRVRLSQGESRPGLDVFRTDRPAGCTVTAVSGLGAAPARFGRSLLFRQADCRSVLLDASTHLVQAESVPFATGWVLYDPSGQPVCDHEQPICRTVEAGPHTLVVVDHSPDSGEPTRYDAAVSDLMAATGCGRQIAPTWASAPVHVGSRVPLQTECRRLDAAPGRRLAVEGETLVYGTQVRTAVLDSEGEVACRVASGIPGCTLTGTAPYRVASWVTANALSDLPYDLVARPLDASGDCPVLEPTAWGVAPTDSHPGIGCRTFEGTAGQAIWLHPQNVGDPEALFEDVLRGPDLAELCVYRDVLPVCTLPTTGTYTLLTSLFDADQRTSFHDLTATEGCRPMALDLASRSRRAGVGQVDCGLLPDTVGAGTPFSVALSTPAFPHGNLVVDADGSVTCNSVDDPGPVLNCTPKGTAPFRVLTDPGRQGDYAVAAFQPDQVDCPRLAEGLSHGSRIVLDDSRQAACVTVDTDRTQHLHLRHDSGGGAQVGAVLAPFETCTALERFHSLTCRRTGSYRIIVIGDGTPSVHTVRRVPSTGATFAFERPRIEGVVKVDATVRATRGEWAAIFADYTYQWLLDGRPISGATRSSLRVPTTARGRHLSVRVTATPSGVRAGIATSASSGVREGAAPTVVTAPAITGTRAVGRRLTASVGRWSPQPSAYVVSWYVGGRFTGVRARSLTLTSAMRGKRIEAVVTARRSGCRDGKATARAYLSR